MKPQSCAVAPSSRDDAEPRAAARRGRLGLPTTTFIALVMVIENTTKTTNHNTTNLLYVRDRDPAGQKFSSTRGRIQRRIPCIKVVVVDIYFCADPELHLSACSWHAAEWHR